MSSFATIKELKKNEVKFKFEELKQKLFFDKPISFKLLTATIVAALEGFADGMKDKLLSVVGDIDLDDIIALGIYLKNSPEIAALFKKANNDLSEETLGSLLLQCEILNDSTLDDANKKVALDKLQKGFLGKNLDDLKDFIGNLSEAFNDFMELIGPYTGIALFLYYIIKLSIDLLTNTEFPSPYRTKYIQKLIRMGLDMLKEIANSAIDAVSNAIDSIKNVFNGVDELLITMAIATALYLYNRVKFQKASEEELSKNLCPDLGLSLANIVVDISTGSINLDSLPLVCNFRKEDNVIVPKEPIESKIENFTCELSVEEDEVQIEAILRENLATKAIIVNKTENVFKYEVDKGEKVTDKTVIATLSGLPVISPINGKVVSLSDSSIVLSDISDSSQPYLTQTIKELNAAYQEQNEIKMFVKDWQVKSLYPVMVSRSADVDTSANIDPLTVIDIGMLDKYDFFKKYWNEKILGSYNKNIQTITGEDNVNKNAKDETLHIIKEQVEEEEKIVNNYLRRVSKQAIDVARTTKPMQSDYQLIDYYIVELSSALNSIKDPSGLTLEYKNKINEFTNQRYVIDGYKPEKIESKANQYFDKLEKGTTNNKWFQKGLDKYNERKKLSDVKSWLENIKNPDKLEDYEKTELIAKLMYLYEFYLNIKTNNVKYKDLKEADNKQQAIKEGNYIFDFFGNLWKRFDALPKEISNLEKRIESLALFTGYSTSEINSQEYRIYVIPDKNNKCKGPDRDPNLGGATETDLGSMKYWLKYCSFATLASLGTGWAIGWLGPPFPIPFPTIYIPIKPITTPYGFIVLGLTITGIWVFPMVLMVNYSSEYALPIFDPTTLLKGTIEGIKNTLSEIVINLKNVTFTAYLENISTSINDLQPEINSVDEQIKNHRIERPPRTKAFEKEQAIWNAENAKLKAELTELKLKKWGEEKKFKIVYEAATLGTAVAGSTTTATDAALKKIGDTEKFVSAQFDKLDGLVEKINLTIAPLPITLQPNTANFGLTLKNPKPIINMASELNDNVDTTKLDNITKPFELDNEKLMTSGGLEGYKYDKMLGAISAASLIPGLAPIKKDPFPAYEKLKLKNFQWQKFLFTDFAPTGSKTYGFPGQPPLPIG